jgi:hypothetical protein
VFIFRGEQMKNSSEVQSAVTPEIRLVVNTEDAAGNTIAKTWRLVLDYRALAIIEKATGRDLKRLDAWKELKSSEFPAFVHAGLHRYHPDVTMEEVEKSLNPACQGPLSDAFFEMCFPGVTEAWKKQQAEGTLPNAPAATPSV